MSSPRKFSEKIALHKKKLAEETAAFEAVLREVSATTKAALEKQQKLPPQIQHLAQPSMAVFRGGSLPNVSEMTSSNSIDLQSALLCLEDMKQGCGRQSLIDKFHRDRNRHMPSSQNQQKRSPMGKRADCSPYGLTYLSPPPDTSWRRTNSDSAIHTSAVGLPQSPQQQHSPPSPTSPVNQHDVVSLSDIHKGIDIWNLENMSCHSRTHDAPGISLYHSSLDETSLLSPISSNSADMQDLTGMQFTSSLCGSLLDGSDQGYVTGGHSDIAGQHARHIGPVRTGQQNSSGTRHRQSHGSPSPLVLYSSSPTHSGIHGILPQDSSVEANTSRVAMCDHLCCRTKLNRSSCRPANNAWTDFGDSRGLRNRDARRTGLRPPKITVAEVRENGLVQHSCYDFDDDIRDRGEIDDCVLDRNMPYGDLCRFYGASKCAANCETHFVGAGSYLLSNASDLKRPNNNRSGFQMCSDFKSPVDSLSQYRNSSDCPQSPTSPLSQHSHSPSDSPGLPNCTISSSPFSDIYALHQQQQQQQQTMAQANLLQQHFEQFAMLQDPPLPPGRSSSLYRLLGQQTQSYPLPVSAGLNFGHPILLSPGKSDQSMDVTPSIHQLTPDLYYQQLSSHPPYSSASGSPGSFDYLAASPTRPRFSVPKSSDQAKSGNKIPDIILTGVDDGHCHVDQFGNGMLLGLKEPFDMELFSIDDALRIGLNPLELEELQMLTNPTVVADPATEDSFRLDQL